MSARLRRDGPVWDTKRDDQNFGNLGHRYAEALPMFESETFQTLHLVGINEKANMRLKQSVQGGLQDAAHLAGTT